MDEKSENPQSRAGKFVLIVDEAHAPLDVHVVHGGGWSQLIKQCRFEQVVARAVRLDETPKRPSPDDTDDGGGRCP